MKRLKAIGLSVLVAGQVTGAGCGNADHAHGVTPLDAIAQRALSAPLPASVPDAVVSPGVARIQIDVRDPSGPGVPNVVVSAGAAAQAKTDGAGRAVLTIPKSPGQSMDRGVIWLEHPGYQQATHVVVLDPHGGGRLSAVLVPKTLTFTGRIELNVPGPDIDLAQVRICVCETPVGTFSSAVRADGGFELRGLPVSNESFAREFAFTFKHPALRTITRRIGTNPAAGTVIVHPTRMDRL